MGVQGRLHVQFHEPIEAGQDGRPWRQKRRGLFGGAADVGDGILRQRGGSRGRGTLLACGICSKRLAGHGLISRDIENVVRDLVGGTDEVAGLLQGGLEGGISTSAGEPDEGEERTGFAARNAEAGAPISFVPTQHQLLLRLGFTYFASQLNQPVGQPPVVNLAGEVDRLEEKEVAQQDGAWNPILAPERGGGAAQEPAVDDIVMQKTGGMNQFDGGGGVCENDGVDTGTAAQMPCHAGSQHLSGSEQPVGVANQTADGGCAERIQHAIAHAVQKTDHMQVIGGLFGGQSHRGTMLERFPTVNAICLRCRIATCDLRHERA